MFYILSSIFEVCFALEKFYINLKARKFFQFIASYIMVIFISGCVSGKTDIYTLPEADVQEAQGVSAVAPVAPIPETLSVMQAIVKKALDSSPDAGGAETQMLGAEIAVASARDAFYPTLSSNLWSANGDGKSDYEVRLSQPIFDFGRRNSNLKGAKANHLASTYSMAATRGDVAYAAAQAYITIKLAEALIEVNNENVDAHHRFVELGELRLSGGVADRAEAELAQVRLATAEAARTESYNTLEQARTTFSILVGEEPGNLPEPGRLSLNVDDISNIAEATDRSPRLWAARSGIEQAEAQITVERASLLPTLSADAYIAGGEFSTQRQVVGIRLSGPSLTGFSQFRNVQQARLNVKSAQLKVEAIRRDITETLSDFIDNDQTLASQLEILRGQLAKARSLRTVYEDQFKLGTRSISDLLSVQTDIYTIARTMAEDRYQRLLIQYRAAAVMGELEAELGLSSSTGVDQVKLPSLNPLPNSDSTAQEK